MAANRKSAVLAVLGAVSVFSVRGETTQLSFDSFAPSAGTCELNQLGFLSNPRALKLRGTIKREDRGYVCTVSVPKSEIGARFLYCALAFVESPPTSDYV